MAGNIYKIASGVNSVTATAATKPRNARGDGVAIVQVEITGTATIQVQGRLDDSAPWQDLLETAMTTSGFAVIALPPQVRVNVTVYSSGVVNAWLME